VKAIRDGIVEKDGPLDGDEQSTWWNAQAQERRLIRTLAVKNYLSSNPEWLTRWLASIPSKQHSAARSFACDLIGHRLLTNWTNQVGIVARNAKDKCGSCGGQMVQVCVKCNTTGVAVLDYSTV
jgi:hypothetical protein